MTPTQTFFWLVTAPSLFIEKEFVTDQKVSLEFSLVLSTHLARQKVPRLC